MEEGAEQHFKHTPNGADKRCTLDDSTSRVRSLFVPGALRSEAHLAEGFLAAYPQG